MTKQRIIIGTAVMTTVLALVALWQFRIIVIYVLLSLVLAATFRPIAKSESRHNITTRLLLILQYIVSLGVVGIMIFLVGRFLVGDFRQLTNILSEQSAWILPAWMEGSTIQQTIVRWLPPPDQIFEAITSQRQFVLSAVLGITQGIGGFVSGIIIILLLSVYWSINQNHFERLWLSLLPAEQRKRARYIWRTIEHDLGAYSRSEIIQSLLAVVILGVGYWLLGSPYPALLAVTGAVAWLIPVVGGALALILPLLLGYLSSPELSLSTVLFTLAVLTALEIWVKPRFFKLKSDNPVLTFVLLLAMADAFGLLGIIVAPPISVIVQILWRLLVSDRLASDPKVQILDLQNQKAHLLTAIEEMKDPPPPLVVSSVERLSSLLDKAEPILQGALPVDPPDQVQPMK